MTACQAEVGLKVYVPEMFHAHLQLNVELLVSAHRDTGGIQVGKASAEAHDRVVNRPAGKDMQQVGTNVSWPCSHACSVQEIYCTFCCSVCITQCSIQLHTATNVMKGLQDLTHQILSISKWVQLQGDRRTYRATAG